MALIPPLFISPKADPSPDPTLLQPTDWNRVVNLLNRIFDSQDPSGSILLRDTSDLTDGARWLQLPNNATLYLDGTGAFSVPGGAGTGNVTGPASAVVNNLATYSTTTGKVIKDAGIASTNLALLAAPNTFTAAQTVNATLNVNNNATFGADAFLTGRTYCGVITSNTGVLAYGDLNLSRLSAATTGALFFGNASHNLQFNGTSFVFSAALGQSGVAGNVPRLDAANTFTADTQTITGSTFARISLIDQSQVANQRLFSIGSGSGIAWITPAADNLVGSLNPPAFTVDRNGLVKIYADIYEKQRTTPIGHWITVPFNAANFFTDAGSAWTVASGNVVVNQYCLIGRLMIWNVVLNNTTIGTAANTRLYINSPLALAGPFTSGANACWVADAVGWKSAFVSTWSGTYVAVSAIGGTNFAVGNTNVYFTFCGQI